MFFRMDLRYLVFVIARVFADTTAVELSTGNYRFSVKVLLEYRNIKVKTSFNIVSNS